MFEDWELIEASFAMQYPGKDLYDDTMDWKEFITLLAGLRKETPLGQIIAIRSEEDPQILKQFSAEQNQLRTQWRTHCMEQYPKNGCEGDRLEKLSELQAVLEAAFH
ncbi:MAG: Gp15 family bacteriophage protein [Clostridium sp.]|nr:Gp15 family bacteriophage protein [Clostridium sp.]